MSRHALRLTVAGQSVNVVDRLSELVLTDKRAFEADELQVTLSDHDQRLAIPPKGAVVTCELGWYVNRVPRLVNKGEFVVDEVSYEIDPRELSITARSANFRAGMAKIKNKSWHGKTLGEILGTIARRHNLQLALSDELSAVAIEHIAQANESDGHFLTRLGRRYDALANIKNGHLLFLPIGQGKNAIGQHLESLSIDASQCSRAGFGEADRNSEYTGVKAKWRDVEANRLIWQLAGEDEKSQKLQTLFGHQADAQAAADAEWRRMQRGKKTLSLSVTRGMPHWLTETPVVVNGIKPDIDSQSWVTTQVVHSIGESGYTTTAELEIQDAAAPKELSGTDIFTN